MSSADEAVARIDRTELVSFALAICNIDSAGPTEATVAQYIYEWLCREGFKTRKVGLLPDRFNVIGKLVGTGGGYSLLFNSHMDTGVRSTDVWRRRVRPLMSTTKHGLRATNWSAKGLSTTKDRWRPS